MRALYIILLLGLFFWGYKLCNKHLCGNTTNASAAAPAASADDCVTTLKFEDGDNLNIISEENFTFAHSDEKFISPSDDFLGRTIDVVDYLIENTDRVLQIRGYYLSSEDNDTGQKSLGLARAKNIATFFVDQGVSQDQLLVVGKKIKASCVQDSILMKGCLIEFGGKK